MGNRLAVLDIGGTLTRERSIWQFLLERTGRWEGQGETNLAKYLGGEIDYHESCRLDAGLLKGVRYDELKAIAYGVPKHDGLDDVFSYFADRRFTVALVSTGLRLVADFFTSRYAIDYCVVNDLARDGAYCNGDVIVNVADDGKGAVVRDLIKMCGAETVVAFGDSRGDLPVFRLADCAISVNTSDPDLARLATHEHTGSDLGACLAYLPF